MPSTKNSNKSLKIRLCKNGNFFKSTMLVLNMVHWFYFGAFLVGAYLLSVMEVVDYWFLRDFDSLAFSCVTLMVQ